MEKTFVGDVHGKWKSYRNLLDDIPSGSIQVGDMGWGFPDHNTYVVNKEDRENVPPGVSYPPERALHREMIEHSARYIRGNHDNPEMCKLHELCIDDGHTEDGMMFIGGAHSIDKDYRIPGYSWWEDEELSYRDLGEMIAKYEEYKPDVMVTHDIPDTVARHLFPFYSKNDPVNNSRTRSAFDTMFHQTDHKPKIWVFGHWHESVSINILGTDFYCLNELESKTIVL